MTSLVFRVLDLHVVGGLADHPAIEDERGPMSYAQLLHDSACVAAAISHLGVESGTPVTIDLPDGRDQIIAVLACARLGAVPVIGAIYRFAGVPAMFHTAETEASWDLLIRAGRTEPHPAPDKDPDGYEELMREAYGDVFAVLTAGGTVS